MVERMAETGRMNRVTYFAAAKGLKMLYRKFGDRWLIEQVFPALLRWNRWWLYTNGCIRDSAWLHP
jgi:hypothetical protein